MVSGRLGTEGPPCPEVELPDAKAHQKGESKGGEGWPSPIQTHSLTHRCC